MHSSGRVVVTSVAGGIVARRRGISGKNSALRRFAGEILAGAWSHDS
jgi:hypothetical protein